MTKGNPYGYVSHPWEVSGDVEAFYGMLDEEELERDMNKTSLRWAWILLAVSLTTGFGCFVASPFLGYPYALSALVLLAGMSLPIALIIRKELITRKERRLRGDDERN